MSIYNALYGRDGHGVGPNEPEKKGFARFCQMVGRDLGQLLGTNLMVCVHLPLPATPGLAGRDPALSAADGGVCSAVTGLLVGPAMVLLADCALRSLGRTAPPVAAGPPTLRRPLESRLRLWPHWHAGACGLGCILAAARCYYPGLTILVFRRLWIFWCADFRLAGYALRCRAAAASPCPGQPAAPGG